MTAAELDVVTGAFNHTGRYIELFEEVRRIKS